MSFELTLRVSFSPTVSAISAFIDRRNRLLKESFHWHLIAIFVPVSVEMQGRLARNLQ